MRRLAALALGAAAMAVPVACARAADGPAAAAGEAGAHSKQEPFGRMTVDEVEAAIAKGEAAVFDNNGRKRFDQGHLPGAKWVKPAAMTAADLPSDKGKRLVFYCSNEH